MRLFLCCLPLVVAVNAIAQTDYWVVVGSFGDLENATARQLTAGERLSESFSLQPESTDRGFVYRVVAGPFFSEETAQRLVAESNQNGFAGAWMFAVESGVPGDYDVDLYTPAFDSSDLPSDLSGTPLLEPYDGELPEVDLSGRELPVKDEKPEKRPPPDEAPADYKLNKLNRDQTAINWSSPYLLASTSSSVLAAAIEALAAADTPENFSGATGRVEVEFETGDLLVLREWSTEEAAIKIDGRLDEPWGAPCCMSLLTVKLINVPSDYCLFVPSFTGVS